MKENIQKIFINDFINNLPDSFPGARVCVLNVNRNENLKDIIEDDIVGDSVFIKVDGSDTEKVLVDLAAAVKNNRYIFVSFTQGLDQKLFSQLELLSNHGWIDFQSSDDGLLVKETLKENAHVFLVSERKFIETQYGNLNNLTTQILNLEE